MYLWQQRLWWWYTVVMELYGMVTAVPLLCLLCTQAMGATFTCTCRQGFTGTYACTVRSASILLHNSIINMYTTMHARNVEKRKNWSTISGSIIPQEKHAESVTCPPPVISLPQRYLCQPRILMPCQPPTLKVSFWATHALRDQQAQFKVKSIMYKLFPPYGSYSSEPHQRYTKSCIMAG